jgi:adenylate cyclase
LLANLCQQPIIEKTRSTIHYQGQAWESDEFFGENKWLIVAEIELSTENQGIIRPEWIGKEVSADRRYGNASLVYYPFSRWRSGP